MTSYPLVASFRLLSNFSGSSRAQLDKWVDIKGRRRKKGSNILNQVTNVRPSKEKINFHSYLQEGKNHKYKYTNNVLL